MIRFIRRASSSITSRELQKLWPIVTILTLVAFNYSVLRCMKDSMIVTAAGAEALPFIKVWAVLPSAVICTLIFTKLSARFTQERVFYIVIGAFLSYFLLFAFILYPNREFLHPLNTEAMGTYLPAGAKGFVSMFQHWTLTLFYVSAEMWSTICLSVLCWGFINSVMSVKEAGRFYGLLNVGSNVAAILAGQVANFFSQPVFNPDLPFGSDAWEQTLVVLVILLTISGLATMAIFRYFHTAKLGPVPDNSNESYFLKKARAKEQRLSLKQSFSALTKSPYLLYITAMVVCYSLVINLVEVVWKDQVQILYPSTVDYNTFMNNVTSIIGVISTIAGLLTARLSRKNGFTKIALITPIILMITGTTFFGLILFEDIFLGAALSLLGTTPLTLVVMTGAIQNVLSKGAKYSFFDATKEMAFIPLDRESQVKGKAVIDGVTYRLGKSGGSFLHQGLMITFGGLAMSTPYLAFILVAVITIWMSATKKLGTLFTQMTSDPSATVGEEVSIETDSKPLKGSIAVEPN